MNNLVKMTRSAYTTAKANRTLVCPNVALISDEYQNVEYLAQNPPSDIGICAWEDGHRTFYSLAQWEELETKPTALGVYVFTEQTQFFIHGTIAKNKWSNEGELIEGVTTTTNGATALLDLAGESNSQAVLDAVTNGIITGAPIFSDIRALTCADSSAVFYLAALGQAELIMLNLTIINNLRVALGQSAISDGYILTSTQHSGGACWGRNFSHQSWTNIPKESTSYSGLAISDL